MPVVNVLETANKLKSLSGSAARHEYDASLEESVIELEMGNS